MKSPHFFCIILSIFMATSHIATDCKASKKTAFIISIPKSGTHLLWRCIEIMTNKGVAVKMNPHYKYTDDANSFMDDNNYIKFFIYRDPRDQIISSYFWVQHEIENIKLKQKLVDIYNNFEKFKGSGANYLAYKDMHIDNFIHDLIYNGSNFFDGFGGPFFYKKFGKKFKTYGINEFYNSFLPWMNVKNVCVVKFENLVGANGGGSQELQFAELKKIAEHLGIQLTPAQIVKVSQDMFGKTHTFREGKIGGWRKQFKPEHTKAFNDKAGELLKNLGYEID